MFGVEGSVLVPVGSLADSIRSWKEFKDHLLECFQTSREGDFYEQFFALREVKVLLKPTRKVVRDCAREEPYEGLKLDIRAAVRVLRPRGLWEAINLAQLVEDKNYLERSSDSSSSGVSNCKTAAFLVPKV
ncbi:hypothetical protein MA16_Dca013589 [Dendrobium catenatum]|uniref:Retrotransposon gag domain-containing protein n=1 Tax=Dendrobium catenatum TaxID=906689 RepID=A0A2I0VPV1_9ASPA|nr:hypothetical protein MA16_Dca013589 [Dendrobium catenatum]